MIHTFFRQYADTLKALAHPRRLEIVHLLRNQTLTVTQLYQMLDLPQANISQHLQVLRDHHLVSTQRRGKQVIYSISDKKVIEACDLLHQFVKEQHGFLTDVAKDLVALTPLVHDPVCKMQLSPKLADFSSTHRGQRYYFCASGCHRAFIKNPIAYLKKARV